jgi:hypothetical protein
MTFNSIHKALVEALALNKGSIDPGKIEIYLGFEKDRRVNLIIYGSNQTKAMLTYYCAGNKDKPKHTIKVTNSKILNKDHLFNNINQSLTVLLDMYSSLIKGLDEIETEELKNIVAHPEYLSKFNYILSIDYESF